MKTQNLTFGAKMRELRLKQGLTQAQVAEAIHVSAQAYSRWENDERQPSYELLAELLYVLGNPTFQIKNKEIKIGDEKMKTVRKYLEIPTYEEVMAQYQTIVSQTKELTTISEIQQFAKQHPEYLIEINYDSVQAVDTNDEIEVVRYEYKNLMIYANIEDGDVIYYPWMTLYDDEGNQFDDCRYLVEEEYWTEINRVTSHFQSFTPNPDYPHH